MVPLAPPAPQPAASPRASDLAAQGDAAFLAERYDDAEALYRRALEETPGAQAVIDKANAAAVAVLTRIREDDPQSTLFTSLIQPEILLGGPHPGNPPFDAAAVAPAPKSLPERIAADLRADIGAVVGAVATPILEALTQGAGESGVSDKRTHLTNWYDEAASGPKFVHDTLQLLKLSFMRNELFARDIVRTYADGSKTGFCSADAAAAGPPASALYWRTADGSWNDLRKDKDGHYDPLVGAAGTRFFRNVGQDRGLGAVRPRPNPGVNPVSVRELSRTFFQPRPGAPRAVVPFLNMWAAAWIQFMNHDWVSHGTPDRTTVDSVPLAPDDPLRAKFGIDALQIAATPADPTRCAADGALPPTHVNEVTHWWDGSQLYGSDAETQARVRSHAGGRLLVGEDGLIPVDPATGLDQTGFVRNWWLGLGMLHSLFAREHNAIAARLAAAHPAWDDERLFQTARLVNAAVMAKIHTVEWTPGILANEKLHEAMLTNWYGMLTTKFGGAKKRAHAFPIKSAVLGGIVGGEQATFARYGLSEEFTAVYRLHSLLPDEVVVQPAAAGGAPTRIPLSRTRHKAAPALLREHGLERLAASFGVQHPGQLVNNNYPPALLEAQFPGSPVVDLGATDLYRDRERGVPPFNQFRAEIGLSRFRTFDEITPDAELAARLRASYGVHADGSDRVEDLDLLVGTLCEGHRPSGFGFGETMFQIFILNASFRLIGDRFFTSDYRPEVYSAEGIEWVDEASFKGVLLRHFPGLEASTGLGNVRNAFEPWDEGAFDSPEMRARHPTRAFDSELAEAGGPGPWAGERATAAWLAAKHKC